MLRLAYLLLLSLYVMGGVFIAPFHGDEADHLAAGRDYVAYFVIGDPLRLRVDPPIAIHSDSYLRLLRGTVSAYLTGAVLWNTGLHDLEQWPGAWYYPDSVAENRAAGRWPRDDVLWRGRLASALLMAGGLWVMAAIAARLRNPRTGLYAATLFALHPVILLNGRRAMQEGALMCFTLLLVWSALRLAEYPTRRRWLLFGLMAALTLASKPSGLIAVVSVLGGLVILGPVTIRDKRDPTRQADMGWGSVFATLFLVIGIYLLLTPAVWSNPPARLWDAAQRRAQALAGQTAASRDAYEHIGQRVAALVTQPFPARIQYYESDDFALDAQLKADIAGYQAGSLRGLLLPGVIGMGLAVVGYGYLSKKVWRRAANRGRIPIEREAVLVLMWASTAAIALGVTVPLAWQRYYLPWTLAVVLLAAIGLDICLLTIRYKVAILRRFVIAEARDGGC